tara:strand:- start:395 stop:988 length:594 start_codon:yes stop_codon:yes gene_type:complete
MIIEIIKTLEAKRHLLDDRETDILASRLGLDGTAKTLQQLGNLYGLTRERVRQLEQGAYKKIGVGSSKDSKKAGQLIRHELFDKESLEILEAITLKRFKTRRPFTEIAKMLGMDYPSPQFQMAVRMFFKKYKNTPEAEVLSDDAKAMIEYKEKHPLTTQKELGKKFNVYNPEISRKYKRLGLKWKDVRFVEEYTRPT